MNLPFRNSFLWIAFSFILLFALWVGAVEESFVRKIMPGDRLRITVSEQPDLNKVYAVAGDGTIDMQLLGRIPIVDLSAQEAADLVEQKLTDGYFRKATVDVQVSDFVEGSILIMGAVQSPGEIPFRGDDIMTLTEAIARRGGLLREAAGTEVRILRWKPGGTMERQIIIVDVQTMMEDLDFKNDQYLRPRDMIIVPTLDQVGGGSGESREFLTLGEFGSPGFHPHSANMDMIRAITRSGGVTRLGVLSAARLLRLDEATGQYVAIPVDLSRLFGSADMSMNMPVRAGDIIFVPSAEQATGGQVFLLGEVQRQGSIPLPLAQESTLAKTILNAGGFTKFSNEGKVRVLRDAPDGTKQTLTFDAGRILKTGAFEDDLPLLDGDVIIVPERILSL